MGILDMLSRVGLVEAVPEAEPSAPATPAKSSPPPLPSSGAQSVVTPVDQALVESIDKIAREKLGAAMDASSKLVSELADTVATLADAIPDESVRYRKAISLMTKRGVPMSAIAGDLDACIGALEQESRLFSSQLQEQFDKKVGSKVRSVEQADATIAAKSSEIQRLQSEVQQMKVQRDQEFSGIASEQSRLDLTKSRFELVYRSLRSLVEAQKAKIMQYGGAV